MKRTTPQLKKRSIPRPRRRIPHPRVLLRRRITPFPRKTFFALNLVILLVAGFGYMQYSFNQAAEQAAMDALLIDEPLHPVTVTSVTATTPTPTTSLPKVTEPEHDVHIPPIENGLAPVISRLETKEPVVFLGIDDGTFKQQSVIDLMKKHKIKASIFLANSFIKDNPAFFIPMTRHGSLIENHSMTHRLLSRLSYDEQKKEICGQADLEEEQFGRRPIFFRPPGGDYNVDTQRAAADCGMKAVVLWIAKTNGGSMQYQVGQTLRPGDIVLMHFRPEFAQDMQAFIDAQNAARLRTELLNGWLPKEPATEQTED